MKLDWTPLAAVIGALVALFAGVFLPAGLDTFATVTAVAAPVLVLLLGACISPIVGWLGYALLGFLIYLAVTGLSQFSDNTSNTVLLLASCTALAGILLGLRGGDSVRLKLSASGAALGPYNTLVITLPAIVLVLVLVLVFDPQGVLTPLQSLAVGFLLGLVAKGIGFGKGAVGGSTNIQADLSQARHLLIEHKLPQARKLLAQLVESEPDNLELLETHYHAWKFDPQREEFHQAAATLFAHALKMGAKDQFYYDWYRDYLAVTQGRPDLPNELHMQIAEKLVRAKQVDEAASIVNLFLRRNIESDQLPACMLALAEGYVVVDRKSKAMQYADTVATLYPDSEPAERARRLRDNLSS